MASEALPEGMGSSPKRGVWERLWFYLKDAMEGLTQRERLLWFIIIFEFLMLSTMIGAGQIMSAVQADAMASSVGSSLPVSSGPQAVAMAIFKNNYFLALLMDLPLAGPVMAAYISFNSGLFVSAQAIASSSPYAQISGVQELLSYLSLPTFWLEFFAYTLSTLEGLYLVVALFTRKFLSELPKLIVVVISVAVILFVSAEIEALFYT
ncbi:MAG: hypothetical protein ACP5GO_02790 [Thermoprotei archaeon]